VIDSRTGAIIRAIPIELDGIGPQLPAVANGFIFTVGEVGGFFGLFAIGALRNLSGSFALALGTLVVASLVTVIAGYALNEPGTT